MASSSTSSNARRFGRPPAHNLFVQPSATPTQHINIGLYLSSDGRRLASDAPSPPRKKRRVEPSDLDDNFAQWDPGNSVDWEDSDDDGEDEMNGPARVVSNLELLETRQRYISSVSCRSFFLFNKHTEYNRTTPCSYGGKVIYRSFCTRCSDMKV